MGVLADLYKHSLALLTDLYELTMACGYWKLGRADREAAFAVLFRRNPFGGGFTIACGLEYVVDWLSGLRFTDDDVAYLGGLAGNDGRPIFEKAFLEYLRAMELGFDVDAVPEGTVVFPQEPLVRVTGPLLQCQIVETALLNVINFQSLIATKAARVCAAAQGEPVLEFGLRRAHGIDGGVTASRAAYIAGCAGTSNVLAGKLLGIPVKGTHAHSWVMSFDDELESFDAYARAMPNNCVFLVDTYDTLAGVRKAAQVGRRLKDRGFEMVGIRLDSGDLAYLSIEARKILDEAGLADTVIIASNDLDEQIIASLKAQGATICVWGVGTRLVTAYDQPALGGVYKLTAVRDEKGNWAPRIKLSDHAAKVTTPGVLQVRRYRRGGEYIADMIYDESAGAPAGDMIIDPTDATRRKVIPPDSPHEDLLVPIFRDGRCACDRPPLEEIRRRVRDQLAMFHDGIKRFVNPHEYPVGLGRELHETKDKLIRRARGIGKRGQEPFLGLLW